MPLIQDTYSVNVQNRYDLGFPVDDEDQQLENIDPHEQLRKLEEERELERVLKKQKKLKKSLPASKDSKKNNAEAPVVPATDAKQPSEQSRPQQRSEYRGKRQPGGYGRQNAGNNDERFPPRRRNYRGGQYRNNEGGYRNENQKVEGGNNSESRPERSERFRGNRGGFRGSRNNRGTSRYDGRDDRGRREFDRHSGNDRVGVRATDKRDGAGPHNWGTVGNELEEVTDALDAATVGQDQEEQPAKTEAEEAEKKNEENEEEVEPVVMTLDEWKASQTRERKQEFNIRKPNEGGDQKWADYVPLKQDEPEKKGEAVEQIEYESRRQNKTLMSVEITFAEQHRLRGRGRGLRNSGRGNRSNGGGRGGNYKRGGRYNRGPPIPDMQNEKEFPTLASA